MANDLYDPQAVEDHSAGSQYLSLKDVKKIGIVIAVMAVLMIPIYRVMVQNSEKARCTQNMRAIQEALSLYAQEHDNRYPPIARTESLWSDIPSKGPGGFVYTWASDIASYMSPRASFRCPSADESEVMMTEDPNDARKGIPLTYGMYEPYAGFQTSLIDNPDDTILIAETSNRGANGSFDPKPMIGKDGSQLDDAFVIGWDTGGIYPTEESRAVTHLAFPNTSSGEFKTGGVSRHGKSNHFMTASGKRIVGGPEMGLIQRQGPKGPIRGSWVAPPKALQTR